MRFAVAAVAVAALVGFLASAPAHADLIVDPPPPKPHVPPPPAPAPPKPEDPKPAGSKPGSCARVEQVDLAPALIALGAFAIVVGARRRRPGDVSTARAAWR